MVFDKECTSFDLLSIRSNRLANGLASLGVNAGDRIAVVDVNTPQHLEIFFAVQRLDAIYVPLNFRGRGDEIQFPLEDSSPKVVFAGRRYTDVLDSIRRELVAQPAGFVVVADERLPEWSNYSDLLGDRFDQQLGDPSHGPDETAVLLYTAGTTGRPKAVMLTHSSFTSYLLTSVDPPDPELEEKSILTLPMYHVAGMQSALASVYGGRSLVIQRQFEPGEWLQLVDQHKVARALVVPTMLKQLIEHPHFQSHDLSSLRVLTYGGASMPPSLIERAIRLLPGVQFINAFGQTETGSTIAMVPPEDHVLEGPPEVVAKRRRHLASIGLPLPDVEIRLVDENARDLPAGETGEIVARGPRIMNGYWGQESATRDTVRGGWLYTGDLGYQDEDGYIYLQGRARDFIKRGGEMIAPEEIENILHGVSGVAECAVVGAPDEIWGELPVAFIVTEREAQLSEADVLNSCVNVARYKRPTRVVFVDELPRNPLGKVLKRQLREWLTSDSRNG